MTTTTANLIPAIRTKVARIARGAAGYYISDASSCYDERGPAYRSRAEAICCLRSDYNEAARHYGLPAYTHYVTPSGRIVALRTQTVRRA